MIEAAEPTITTAPPQWPEASEEVQVLISPDRRPPAAAEVWLARPDHPDAPLAADVPVDGGRLRWRPGRAVLQGPVTAQHDVLAGVADFAFYEAQLRRLEAALPPFEAGAADDVRIAFAINDADAQQWPRFAQRVEDLAALRLTFARLEPRLAGPSRSLPLAGRRVFRRLLACAAVEDRLAAVTDRLEACEDLYEGAVDRITDHRWWRKGHRLEAVIVVLLAVEGLQLAAELVLHLLQFRGR